MQYYWFYKGILTEEEALGAGHCELLSNCSAKGCLFLQVVTLC